MSQNNNLNIIQNEIIKDHESFLRGTFDSSDGVNTISFLTKKSQMEKKHFVFIHDICLHADLHIDLLDEIYSAREDLSVTFIDLPGHGLSTGSRGHIESYKNFAEDVFQFINSIEEEVILGGHGVGALIVCDILIEKNSGINCAYLANPAIKLNFELPTKAVSFFSSLDKNLFKVKFPRKFSGSHFCHDLSWCETFDGDPLVNHFLSFATLNQIDSIGRAIQKNAYFIETKLLIHLSDIENIYQKKAMKQFSKAIHRKDSKVSEFEGSKHNLFNDIHHETIILELQEWLRTN